MREIKIRDLIRKQSAKTTSFSSNLLSLCFLCFLCYLLFKFSPVFG